MKITKQHFEDLENHIKHTLSQYPEEEIIQARKTVKFVKNQFIAFCWLVLHKTVKEHQSLRQLLDNYLDSHIETAIKKILIKYKLS